MTAKTAQIVPVSESTAPLNVQQRLLAVVGAAGALRKSGKASYGNQFPFHKIDDVVDHLRPLLVEYGVVVLVSVAESSLLLGETKDGNPQWAAEATLEVTFINADNPEDRETIRAWGQGLDSSDKGAGKAISYALKNAYLAIFQLRGQPDVEDDNHQRAAKPAPAAAPKGPPSEVEVRKAAMAKASKEGKWSLDNESWERQCKFCVEHYGGGFAGLAPDAFDEFLLWIRSGGEWPEGYENAKLKAQLDDDVAEIFDKGEDDEDGGY